MGYSRGSRTTEGLKMSECFGLLRKAQFGCEKYREKIESNNLVNILFRWKNGALWLVGLQFNGPVNTAKVMSS